MAWPRDAYVGQKVVAVSQPQKCISHPWRKPTLIEVGKIYTIREVVSNSRGVFLDVGMLNSMGTGAATGARHFRPVEPQKPARSTETGMSTLRALLKAKPARKPVGEGV